MRTKARGSPSWPRAIRPEAGYVCADCQASDHQATCRRGGPYVCTGCVLVSAHHCAVDHVPRPVQVARVVGASEEPIHELLPQPTRGPAMKARGDRAPRAEAFGQCPPRCASASQPHKGVEHPTVVNGWATSAWLIDGQQRRGTSPLRVGERVARCLPSVRPCSGRT